MKKIIWGCAILALTLFSVGCNKDKRPVVRVATFLGDPALIKIMNRIIANIEKENPDFKIKLDLISYNDYQNKITTELVGGNPPDVMFTEVGNFVDLYLRGAFEDLLPYMKRDGIDIKAYYPDVLGRFTRDGHILVMPQDTAPSGLVYYNKKFFRDAGVPYPTGKWKWPEPFLSICKKLVRRDKNGKIIQWAFSEEYPISLDNFMYSNGGSYVDNVDHPTRFTMDTPQAIQAAQFRWDLVYKYHVSPTRSEVQSFGFNGSTQSMFMNGQIAMMTSGIWDTPTFLEKEGLEFDVAEFPMNSAGKKGWSTGGSGFAICKASKNKELAWRTVKILASADSLSQMALTGFIQPALKYLTKTDAFLKSPGPAHKTILLEMPKYSHYSPFMSNWTEINNVYGSAMDPVWLGEKNPTEALPGITKTINEKFFDKK